MPNYDLEHIMERFPVLAKAALATVNDDSTGQPQSCDAVHFWPYQQEAFPYWWHRIDDMTPEEDPGGDLEIHVYSVSAALVIAHLSADAHSGYSSDKAYRWMAAYLNYMRSHRTLVDGTTYTSPPDWLWTAAGGAKITGIPNGTRTLANSGVGTQQVAVVFTIELPLLFELY